MATAMKGRAAVAVATAAATVWATSRRVVGEVQVAVLEAHGTGTALGDPIETSSLAAVVLRPKTGSDPVLVLGSGKANMGHAETGAGLTGLMKHLPCSLTIDFYLLSASTVMGLMALFLNIFERCVKHQA